MLVVINDEWDYPPLRWMKSPGTRGKMIGLNAGLFQQDTFDCCGHRNDEVKPSRISRKNIQTSS